MNKFQTTCLQLAKASILEEFGQGDHKKIKLDDEQFGQKRACFVTLKMDDELRGCIGSIIPHQSLADDIISNAKSAAFQDPRFSPLSLEEIKHSKLNVGITILSPTEEKTFKTTSDLYSFLEKEQGGLIIEYGYRGATFLPSVREELHESHDFVLHLLYKAGISLDEFQNDFKSFTFKVYYGDEFKEDRAKITIG